MDTRTKYFILRALRLAILCGGLAAVIMTGSSVLPGNGDHARATLKSEEAGTPSTDRVNINTATLKQLMDLPTIGQVIGSRIIEYRQQHGPFKRASDIIIIKGISEHKFRQLEDLITVD